MNLETYLSYWNPARPAMLAKLTEFREALRQQLPVAENLTMGEIYDAGDAELRLVLDLTNARHVCVLSLNFVLTDAEENGLDKEGVGVMLNLEGYDALALGQFAPYNYTPDAFTADLAVVLDRINSLDVASSVDFIINTALTNPALVQAVANA